MTAFIDRITVFALTVAAHSSKRTCNSTSRPARVAGEPEDVALKGGRRKRIRRESRRAKTGLQPFDAEGGQGASAFTLGDAGAERT